MAVWVFSIRPSASSIEYDAFQKTGLSLLGLIPLTIPTTVPLLLINKTSIANFIKNIWMELHFVIIRASSSDKLSRFRSPTILEKKVSALFALPAIKDFFESFTIFILSDRPAGKKRCLYERSFLNKESRYSAENIFLSMDKPLVTNSS